MRPGITSVAGLEPGDLFTTDGKDVWELVSFCEVPTATLKNLRTGETTGGGVGCLNLSKFLRLAATDGSVYAKPGAIT